MKLLARSDAVWPSEAIGLLVMAPMGRNDLLSCLTPCERMCPQIALPGPSDAPAPAIERDWVCGAPLCGAPSARRRRRARPVSGWSLAFW